MRQKYAYLSEGRMLRSILGLYRKRTVGKKTRVLKHINYMANVVKLKHKSEQNMSYTWIIMCQVRTCLIQHQNEKVELGCLNSDDGIVWTRFLGF
jgi:hypothetical protein